MRRTQMTTWMPRSARGAMGGLLALGLLALGPVPSQAGDDTAAPITLPTVTHAGKAPKDALRVQVTKDGVITLGDDATPLGAATLRRALAEKAAKDPWAVEHEDVSDLKAKLNLAMLFIGHDLTVIEHVSDRVMVLYLGKVMEIAPVSRIYAAPAHPYTEALLSAAPAIRGQRRSERIILKGEQPSPANPPSGCVFRTRCRYAVADCARTEPRLTEVAPGHFKACIRDDVP